MKKPEKTTPPAPRRGKPERVTVKGSTVTIYATPRKIGGRSYTSYTLSYTSSGRRCRKAIADLDEAREAARTIAAQLSQGTGHVHSLTVYEVADYAAAMRALRRHPGTALAAVADQWADAMRLLPKGTPLSTVAKFYADYLAREKLPTITPRELAAQFIAAKEREGLSDFYLQDIRRKLARFAAVFACPVASITAADIARWVESQGVGRNANNLRSAVSALFGFARERGYLPAEKKHAAELVRKFKEKVSPIGIYTPAELRDILAKCPPRIVPVIAVSALAGLRVTEAFRLDWHEVKLAQGQILVAPEKAKTASRRIVPICPALREWLAPYAKDEGGVAPCFSNLENISRVISAAVEAAGVTPQQNGFRHSFASYRLAEVQSADKVALEMGNSPRKVFTNYRELVTSADAAAWFSVKPRAPKNVVRLAS